MEATRWFDESLVTNLNGDPNVRVPVEVAEALDIGISDAVEFTVCTKTTPISD